MSTARRALLALRQLDAALAACQAALRLQAQLGRGVPGDGACAERPAAGRRRRSPPIATRCGTSPTCPTCTTTWGWCCGRRAGWRRPTAALRQAVAARAARCAGAGQPGRRAEGAWPARRGRGAATAPRCAGVRTIRCCISIWGSSCCWRAGSTPGGRNTSGGSAPARHGCRRAASRAGNGERLAGRTLLIRAEQGIGDTIQFCRYVPMVAARATVVLEVQPGLRRLVRRPAAASGSSTRWRRAAGVRPLVPAAQPAAPARACRRRPRRICAADADRVADWRDRIGRAWPADRHRLAGQSRQRRPSVGRSIPLAQLLPLAQVPGVRLISLQKHHGLEQLAGLPDGLRIETLGDDFDAGPDAFIDTAAVMQCLDLVITSDTSVAHLAGALGRPVWVGPAARARLAVAARGRGLPLVSDHASVPPDAARRLGRRVRPHGGRML